MSGDDEPVFDSDAAALAHYRDRCLSLQAQLANTEQDLVDFTESSQELQAELEQELGRVEQAEKTIRRDLDDAKNAADEWKAKYTTALRDHTATISHMQRELETLRATEKSLRARVRDMELDNDDLEKSEREKDSSLQDLETRYNKSLERIALLEEELVTKAQLEEEVQRLKDELREVNEELAFTRTQLAAIGPPHPSSAPSPVPPTPVEPESPSPFPSAAPILAEDASRRTPSPSSHTHDSPSPSIELTNPTPLLSSRVRPSATSSPSFRSPSKIARSTSFSAVPPSPAPFSAPLVQGAPALARSTRTAHLARGPGATGGLTSSPSTPVLASPAKQRAARLAQSPSVRGGIPRTDTATMIRDMQQMTTRVRALTQRLDHRRESVMRGSAIPRIGSPTAPSASSSGLGSGIARSATVRGLSSTAVRPPSRLGAEHSYSHAASSSRESSRPPSRSSGLRASLAAPRPPSRMSSLSASSSASRPGSPLPSRSPTPTLTTCAPGIRASTRPGSALGLGRSLGPPARRATTAGAPPPPPLPPVTGLARSMHARAGSAASTGSGRSTEHGERPRPGSALGHSSDGKAARRVSGGFGLLGRSIRRRSVVGEAEGGQVPSLPGARDVNGNGGGR